MGRARGHRHQGAFHFVIVVVQQDSNSWQVDFNDLPTETLYRYLEQHDLLPHWDVSPWSEEPCVLRESGRAFYIDDGVADPSAASALYSVAPPPPSVPIVPEVAEKPAPVQNGAVTATGDIAMADAGSVASGAALADSAAATPSESVAASNGVAAEGEGSTAQTDSVTGTNEAEAVEEAEEGPTMRTTRSKTAPQRKPASITPPPAPRPKRGVVALSDVHAARAVLSEKANAHWVKGLGGGQNKEGETIVNFLYKMKAGPGERLLTSCPGLC